MIENIFRIILNLSLHGAIAGIIIYFALKVFGRRLTPKFKYLIWILLFIKLILPINFYSNISFYNLVNVNDKIEINLNPLSLLSKTVTSSPSDAAQISNESNNTENFTPEFTETEYGTGIASSEKNLIENIWSSNLFKIISYVWLYAMLISFLCVLWNYLNLKINIYKEQSQDWDADYEEIIHSCFSDLKIPQNTEIVFTSYSKSPYVFGFFKPLIVLPANILSLVSKEEFKSIIYHEATHIKLNHHKIKFVTFIITIIHWFNPFIWLYLKVMNENAEHYCDYYVLNNIDFVSSDDYLNSLVKVAKLNQNKLSLTLGFGKNTLKRRVVDIMNRKSIPNYAVILSVLLTIILGATLLTSAIPSVKTDKNANEVFLAEASSSSFSSSSSSSFSAHTSSMESNSTNNNNLNNVTSLYTYDEKNIDSLNINASSANVIFKESNNKEITVELITNRNTSTNYNLNVEPKEDNTLYVMLTRENSNYDVSITDTKLIISLPQKNYSKLNMTLNASIMDLTPFTFNDIDLTLNASKYSSLNTKFKNLKVSSNASDFSLNTITTNFNANIEGNASSISLVLPKEPSNLNLKVSSIAGEVTMPKQWEYTQSNILMNSSYEYLTGNGENKIDVESRAGNVTIKNE